MVNSMVRAAVGRRRHRVRPLGPVPVGGREAHYVVLAGQVLRRLLQIENECLRRRSSRPGWPKRWRSATDPPGRFRWPPVSPPGSAAPARDRPGRDSRSAPRSRARRGPGPASPATHLALFQKYRWGTSKPGRPAVVPGQGLSVDVPDDPGPAPVTSAQGQVGGVPGVRESENVGGPGRRRGRRQQVVDRHPLEADAELGPRGHAVNIALVLRRRDGVDLVPRPRCRLRHQSLDPERPGGGVQPRGRLRGQYGPAATDVVLSRVGAWDPWSPTNRGLENLW